MSAQTVTVLSRRERWRTRVSESLFLTILDRLFRNSQGVVGLLGLGTLLVLTVGAGFITWHEPNAQDAAARFLSPSLEHPFGTDHLRRDLFARTLFGLRTSLGVALLAVTGGATVGICVGFVTGYAGRWADALAMRVIDAMLAFPNLLSALAVITILGPSARNVAIAIAIYNIPVFARLSRAQMLSEKHRDYVQASRSIGAGPVRLIFRHIAMNAMPPLLTQVALSMAVAVILEASLSFLGLGQQPPAPSLGTLISGSRSYLREAWWLAVFPGAFLALLLLSLNLLADAVNEAMSPWVRRKA